MPSIQGLGLTPDYYIDATSGSDGNTGLSSGQAWATLSKIDATLLANGTTTVVRIAADTYNSALDYVSVNNTTTTGATLILVFEEGCTIDGTSYAGNESAFDPDGNAFTFIVYGNNLTVQNVTTTTGNAFAANGAVHVIYHYGTASGCRDGMSLHDTATGDFYDITVTGSLKAGIAHINTSVSTHTRCSITEASGGGSDRFIILEEQTASTFKDCLLLPDSDGSQVELHNATMNRCQLGTLTQALDVRMDDDSGTILTLRRCFTNVYADGNVGVDVEYCFGRWTSRVRDQGAGQTLRRNVFLDHATNKNRVLLSESTGLGSSKLTWEDNIFLNSTFSFVTPEYATALEAAGSTFRNNYLPNGIADVDADIQSLFEGTLSDDPLVGPANSLLMSDYIISESSPMIGAGANGGDVGFRAGNVQLRATDAMGQAIVTMGGARRPAGSPIFRASGAQTQEINTSGTSQATTIEADREDIAIVINNSSALIWAEFGPNPIAAVGTTHAILPNSSAAFDVGEGDRCALIDDN
ncbi:MAG: hypothetical protein AAFR21_11560 [Pseudomonadota bacterium]